MTSLLLQPLTVSVVILKDLTKSNLIKKEMICLIFSSGSVLPEAIKPHSFSNQVVSLSLEEAHKIVLQPGRRHIDTDSLACHAT